MLTTWMVDRVLRATIILALAWVASLVLRRQAAALRHFVWTLSLASLLLLPTAWAVLPRWTAGIGRRPAAPAAIAAFQTAIPAAAIRPPEQTSEAASWPLLLWGVGCALVLLRWTRGALRTHALLRRTVRADYALPALSTLRARARFEREIRVCESPDTAVAWVWGLRRPVVILPKEAAGWEPDRLRAVLAHELAHVKRWDLATQLLAQFVCALYWFHPLVWLACHRLREERERACDDAVLAAGISAPDYASYLVDLVRSLAAHPPADAPAMAEARDLELRVKAVLNPKQDRRGTGRRLALLTTSAALLFVFALGSFRATAQSASGVLAGTVVDPTGAVIARALVNARNPETGAVFGTVADMAGTYHFAALPPGTYEVTVSVPGFETYESRVTVAAGAATRLDAWLVVGASQMVVNVRGRGNPDASASRPVQPVRIRVGGNVQAPRLVSQPPPAYPEALQQRGVYGSVVLRAMVDKTGQVSGVRVVNITEVAPELADLAVRTVQSWVYTPALLNGEPVSTLVTVTVNFDLVP
jgi:TonB family protein